MQSLKRSRRCAALVALVLLSGCATRAPAPHDAALGARYDEDAAACRAYVQQIDVVRQTLDGIVEGALVTAIVVWGLGRSHDALRDGAAVGGLLGGTSQGLQALERRRQAEIGCMSARGHVQYRPQASTQPAPAPVLPEPPAAPPPALGTDSFNAERLARTLSCGTAPLASLVAKGPGFENYSVPCDNGDALAIRCEFGNCRVLK